MNFRQLDKYCISNSDIESFTIELLDPVEKNKIIHLTYRPPSGKSKKFNTYIKNFITDRTIITKDVFIFGDTNLNLIDYQNPNIQRFTTLLFGNSFIPLINRPTRITKKSATLIDHIITNTSFTSINKSGIIKTDVSDHFPIYTITKKKICDLKSHQKRIYCRKYNEKAILNFKADLREQDWSLIEREGCPNKAFFEFDSIFLRLYDHHFPLVEVKIKEKSLLSPWITKGIKRSSKMKQLLYDKFLKKRDDASLKAYKDYKKSFENVKKHSKYLYYQENLEKHKSDIRRTWQIIKEIVGRVKVKNNQLPSRIVKNDEVLTNEKFIASEFNKYYSSVGPNLAKNIQPGVHDFNHYMKQNNSILINPEYVSENEIKKHSIHLKQIKVQDTMELVLMLLKSATMSS